MIKSAKVCFRGDAPDTKFLVVGAEGGDGIIETPVFNADKNMDDSYKTYLVGPMLNR